VAVQSGHTGTLHFTEFSFTSSDGVTVICSRWDAAGPLEVWSRLLTSWVNPSADTPTQSSL